MIRNISWESYLYTIAITLCLYYLSVVLLFYRSAILQVLKKSRNEHRRTWSVQPSGKPGITSPINHMNDDQEGIVRALMDELDAFFEQSRKSKWQKEDLKSCLQKVLIKYPSIRESIYEEAINGIIINNTEHICSIHLGAGEVGKLWMVR